MDYRLELHGVSRRYGKGETTVTALENISLELKPGEFLAIQGPSGSGKSSLLKLCGLIDTPCDGRIVLDGQPVESFSKQLRCETRRKEIGFMFQRHQLIPAMTVYENIAYPLLLNGASNKQTKADVTEILEKIGLAHRAKHLPKQLSGGERQRVGIARALVKKPQLVIADEPSAALDHKNALISLMLMRELNEQHGASFIIASHDPFVIDHCDRTLHLLDGELRSEA